MPLVLLLGGLAGLLRASTVAHLSFSQIGTLAHRVVIGRIERILSYQDAQSGRILSRVEIAPSRSLPGDLSLSTVSFEMTGGTVGDVRQWIAGFPNLQVGDRVALFLADDTTTPLGPTVGLWQGIFFIEADSITGAETVTDHRRRPIWEIHGEELVMERERSTSTARLTLDAFVGRLRTLRLPNGSPQR
jgi:hypothetical protein